MYRFVCDLQGLLGYSPEEIHHMVDLKLEKKEEDYISTIKESKTNLEEVTMKLAEKESALLLPNSPNVSVLGIIFKIFLTLWVGCIF